MNKRSLCTRCGKPRIIVRSYEEVVEKSVVTYTITKCSDPGCQDEVNKLLKKEKAKRVQIKIDQVRREEDRKRQQAAKKASRIRKSS